MVIISFFDSLVSSVGSKTLVGKDNLSFSVINLQHLYFHLVTRLYDCCHVHAGIVGVFVPCKNTIRLVSDVKDHFFRLNIDNCTFDYLSRVYSF